MRKCDHVGAAVYTSTDGKKKVCYRCGNDIETPQPPASIQERFEAFDAKHPAVLNRLVDFAYQAKRAGRKRIGIKMLFELLRWEWTIEGLPDEAEEWKLNNNYSSRYARRIMDDHPRLEGLFELRGLKSP